MRVFLLLDPDFVKVSQKGASEKGNSSDSEMKEG
jgi:hypothetical protein